MEYDTTGPATLFAVSIGAAIGTCVATFIFVLVTANHLFPLCLPVLSLSPKDPIVLALLGACAFGTLAGCLSLSAQNAESACGWGFKAAGSAYVLCYWCVSLFLLAKLRAVEAGLKANWYVKLQKAVNIATLFGSPLFAVVAGLLLAGTPVKSTSGHFFCASIAPWYVTAVFAVLQSITASAYLLLFIMPLVSTERHVVNARTSDMGKAIHGVIVRNLISCAGSVGSTCLLVTIATICYAQKSLVPGMWAGACYYMDLTVSILSMLYAIHPAWKYKPVELLHSHLASTKRTERDHQSKSHEHSQSSPPPASTGRHTFTNKEHASKRSTKDRGKGEGGGEAHMNKPQIQFNVNVQGNDNSGGSQSVDEGRQSIQAIPPTASSLVVSIDIPSPRSPSQHSRESADYGETSRPSS